MSRPFFLRTFRSHDPLTLKVARTMREAYSDGNDWIEGPSRRERDWKLVDRFAAGVLVGLVVLLIAGLL